MKIRRPIYCAYALFSAFLLAIPAGVIAQAPQPAGKITAVLPVVNVVHGPQQIAASTSQQVFWGDIINTGHLARARVALTDGSILSVGSDSNLTVARHDAAEQQTDLELNYGRVRADAVKLVKPKARFQIRTPTGVAGVVGTDFAVESDNDTTRVVVYKGKVIFCAIVSERKKGGEEQQPGAEGQPSLQEGQEVPDGQDQQNGEKRRLFIGPCVVVAAGATSAVRFNQSPTQPVPATPMTVTTMANATSTSGAAGAGGAAGGGIGATGGAIAGGAAGVAAGVATAVVRGVATTKTCSTPPPTTGGGAVPRSECVNRASRGAVNGQRH